MHARYAITRGEREADEAESGKRRRRSVEIEHERRRKERLRAKRIPEANESLAERRRRDDEARERKAEAKRRGKEIGRARALRRQEERELQEKQRERERIEELERQRDREDERWSAIALWDREHGHAGSEDAYSGRKKQQRLLSMPEGDKYAESGKAEFHLTLRTSARPYRASDASEAGDHDKGNVSVNGQPGREFKAHQRWPRNAADRNEQVEHHTQADRKRKQETNRHQDRSPAPRCRGRWVAGSQLAHESPLRWLKEAPRLLDDAYCTEPLRRESSRERSDRNSQQKSRLKKEEERRRSTAHGLRLYEHRGGRGCGGRAGGGGSDRWRTSPSPNTARNERAHSVFQRQYRSTTPPPRRPLLSPPQKTLVPGERRHDHRSPEWWARHRPPQGLGPAQGTFEAEKLRCGRLRPDYFGAGHFSAGQFGIGHFGSENIGPAGNLGVQMFVPPPRHMGFASRGVRKNFSKSGQGIGAAIFPVTTPLVQGMGTLSASVTGGMGSGTLALGINQGRRGGRSVCLNGLGTLAEL